MRGNHFNRLFISNREAVVATHHDAIGTDVAKQIVKHLFGIADGVVVEASEVAERVG